MASPGPDQQCLLQLGLGVKLTCPELKDYHTQRQLSSGAGVICEINVLESAHQHLVVSGGFWSFKKGEASSHTHELMNKLKLKVYLQCITI